jgi:hypothetical protein
MRSAESTQGVELSDLIFLTSFGDIFRPLRPAFTKRSWPFAVMVAVAWILSAGRRTVTAFIRQTDGKRHWTLGYKFFSVFRWSEWTNAHLLLKKAREIFPLTPIVLVADDTRAGKTGPLIFGGGGFADPAAKPLRFLGAPNGVILGLSVYIPEWKRWYCFPRITRPSLRRKNCPKDGEFRTRLSLVEEMVQEVLGGLQEALSGLGVILVADGAYARKALRRVLRQRSVPRVSRLPWTAALYEAPRGAQAQDAGTQTPRGPPDAEALRARRGGRLQPDDRLDVRQGRHALGEELRGAVEASRGLGPRGHHEISGPAGPEASDRVLLLDGPRPDPAPDHPLVSARWPIEQAIRDAQVRLRPSVRRLTHFGLQLQSLIGLWFFAPHRGRCPADVAPGYPQKASCCFADMRALLRRTMLEVRISTLVGRLATRPRILRAVLRLLRRAS